MRKLRKIIKASRKGKFRDNEKVYWKWVNWVLSFTLKFHVIPQYLILLNFVAGNSILCLFHRWTCWVLFCPSCWNYNRKLIIIRLSGIPILKKVPGNMLDDDEENELLPDMGHFGLPFLPHARKKLGAWWHVLWCLYGLFTTVNSITKEMKELWWVAVLMEKEGHTQTRSNVTFSGCKTKFWKL